MSASFEDRDGKPFVFQLKGRYWRNAMTALGFYEELETIGLGDLGDLGVVLDSNDKRDELLSTLDACFARGHRDRWVKILREIDIVAAPINTLLEASNDPDVLANGYVTEIEYPEFGKTAKVHGSPWKFSKTPAQIGVAPKLGEHTDALLAEVGYSTDKIKSLRAEKVI
jgi:crotonobetainyl-CoA:carnitine CoA-transferase CaiB-like acyl-CoA transferase